MMILLEKISRDWPREGDWRIAPDGISWIAAGHRIKVGVGSYIGQDCHIGNYCSIGDGCRIGDGCSIGEGCSIGDRCSIGEGCSIDNNTNLGAISRIGAGAKNPVDVGYADGWRKVVAQVDGVAYIGAGCKWFHLAAALKHWQSHEEDRRLTICLMKSAVAIAEMRGWAMGDA